jgi:hypothetical protein
LPIIHLLYLPDYPPQGEESTGLCIEAFAQPRFALRGCVKVSHHDPGPERCREAEGKAPGSRHLDTDPFPSNTFKYDRNLLGYKKGGVFVKATRQFPAFSHPQVGGYASFFSTEDMNGLKISMGMGNMVVELFSAAISFSV